MRVYSGSRCYKSFHCSTSQSLYIGMPPKPPVNPSWVSCTMSSSGSCHSFNANFHLINLMKLSIRSHHSIPDIRKLKFNPPGLINGNSPIFWSLGKSRTFSISHSFKGEGARSGNKLPWLKENGVKNVKESEKSTRKNDQSSWKEPTPRWEKASSSYNSAKTFRKGDNRSHRDESARRYGKTPTKSASVSTWETSAQNFLTQGSDSTGGRIEGSNPRADTVDQQADYIGKGINSEELDDEAETIADPRWDRIKSRFSGLVDEEVAPERPEFQRWNKQESWGRKAWKEASESTIPKMVGEGIYGVGPVLAALSAGRREFYALYMQEGLDLSNNNRKKKDKKGFEKVLRLAEKNALTITKTAKHDLNMISDNRPHQGLVLDASPLEMVKIKELEPVSLEEDKGSLWLALDEVTDPQNLGAIVRSAYFFGASGVVLCAKNSAPLSGVVSKASAGSLEIMELRYCKNMMQFLTSSAENGWRVLGASVSSRAVDVKEVLPGAPTILVLGSEGTGLRPLVERSCSHLVKIPGNIPMDVTIENDNDNDDGTTQLRNGSSLDEFRSFLAVESLNVSVAAGVLVHHLIGSNYKNCNLSGSDDSLEVPLSL